MVLRNKKIIAVGGGKGGVGKSFITANLGTVLAQSDKKVTFVDTNMSASNLHTFLGISLPERTLRNFLKDKHENLHSILTRNPYSDALLISGAADVLGLTAPTYNQKQRLFRGLKALNCDVLFLDLPTGSSAEIIDIFMLSNSGLIVVDAMSTTLESTFQFIKNVVYRILIRFFKKNNDIQQFIEEAFSPRSKLNLSTIEELMQNLFKLDRENAEKTAETLSNFRPYFILNSVKETRESDVVVPFQNLVKKYLNVHIQFLGSVAFGSEATESILNSTPVVVDSPNSRTSLDIKVIAEKLI